MTPSPLRAGCTWLHRWCGLVAMGFLVVAAVTGCLLCFIGPLDRALNRDLFVRAEAGAPLDPLGAVDAYIAANPHVQVVDFPLHVAAADTVELRVRAAPGAPPPGYDHVYLDRADGHVAGTRTVAPGWGRRQLMEGVALFHYTLLAGTWGRWIMGVAAIGWLVGTVIGIYLTWPMKRPYWKQWKRTWRFSFSSSLPRLLLDLHRASGLWLLGGLLLLSATSVALNFYSEAYEPVVTRISPLKWRLFDGEAPYPDSTRPTLHFADAVRLAEAKAAADHNHWQPATALYKPDWNLYGVTFSDDGTLNYHRLGPVYYWFDAKSGALRNVVDPYSDSAGLAMIRALFPIHTGEVGGWPTVALVFVLGLATIGHAGTGLYIWLKKRKSRLAARAAKLRPRPAGAP